MRQSKVLEGEAKELVDELTFPAPRRHDRCMKRNKIAPAFTRMFLFSLVVNFAAAQNTPHAAFAALGVPVPSPSTTEWWFLCILPARLS